MWTGSTRTEQFMMNGLDLLSAGLLGRNLGYLLVYPPQVTASRGVQGQDGALEMANVVISNIYSPWLNARVGRFEPAYCAFSAKRQLTVSPYEIYDYAFPQGVPFSDTQTGIEVSGHGRLGSKYAVGVTNGSATNRSGDPPSDAYLRVSHTFMPGDGQTMGQRLGFVGYMGRARSGFDGGCGCRKNFTRFGADVSLNLAHFNLGAQFLMAQDDAKLWSLVEKSDVKYSGGFAELSCLPMTSLVGFARYDWVTTPDFRQAGHHAHHGRRPLLLRGQPGPSSGVLASRREGSGIEGRCGGGFRHLAIRLRVLMPGRAGAKLRARPEGRSREGFQPCSSGSTVDLYGKRDGNSPTAAATGPGSGFCSSAQRSRTT